ncbi:hypothetical protein C8R44DRAFT_731843 [Mycena epipterygia]|nr:hypothetical protein C8R44DRAFT_731843 [Mycena epipterygia]
MSLSSLGEYLILLVCFELPLADVLALRQVCRVLNEATQAKILWIHILERAVQDEGQLLPPYLKRHDLLDAVTLEALNLWLKHKVKTGRLEVQDSGIVLALGVGVESPSVHIITLRTAITEGNIYKRMLSYEIQNRRRNRWIEQAERGGRPHQNSSIL